LSATGERIVAGKLKMPTTFESADEVIE